MESMKMETCHMAEHYRENGYDYHSMMGKFQ